MAETSWEISILAVFTLTVFFAVAKAGKSIAAKMAMIAMTTSSSISVKPRRGWEIRERGCIMVVRLARLKSSEGARQVICSRRNLFHNAVEARRELRRLRVNE